MDTGYRITCSHAFALHGKPSIQKNFSSQTSRKYTQQKQKNTSKQLSAYCVSSNSVCGCGLRVVCKKVAIIQRDCWHNVLCAACPNLNHCLSIPSWQISLLHSVKELIPVLRDNHTGLSTTIITARPHKPDIVASDDTIRSAGSLPHDYSTERGH